MKLARLIWKNAIRNRRRTGLTIASITVSIFLLGTLQAVLSAIYGSGRGSPSGDLRAVVHRATSITQPLPVSFRERIASVPGVQYVVAVNWFGGVYIDPANFFANFAVDTDHFDDVFSDFKIAPDELKAWKNERTAALAGKPLIEKYHWQLGQRITLKSSIYNVNADLIIRGVYDDPADPSQDQSLYFHYDYFNELMREFNQVGTFTVKVDNAKDVPKVMDAIDTMFRNTAYETKTETESAFSLSFVSMLGNIKLLFSAISAAVVFTILLVVGNTMAMSIRERTNEVAVLKTLGFRRNRVLLILLGESLAIALLGGIFGGFGAKLVYAFIVATYLHERFLGFAFGLLIAALSGGVAWLLFAGVSSVSRVVRAVRLIAVVAGTVIGYAVGAGFYMAVGYIVNMGFFFANFRVGLPTVALCLAIALLVGVVSGLWPALRASRISIAEALRYVG